MMFRITGTLASPKRPRLEAASFSLSSPLNTSWGKHGHRGDVVRYLTVGENRTRILKQDVNPPGHRLQASGWRLTPGDLAQGVWM